MRPIATSSGNLSSIRTSIFNSSQKKLSKQSSSGLVIIDAQEVKSRLRKPAQYLKLSEIPAWQKVLTPAEKRLVNEFFITDEATGKIRLSDNTTNKDIAAKLEVSPRTIQTQLASICEKLCLEDRYHLISIFMRRNINKLVPEKDIFSSLTDSEKSIFVLVAQGYSNKYIGKRLSISPRTVQTHISNILQKFDSIKELGREHIIDSYFRRLFGSNAPNNLSHERLKLLLLDYFTGSFCESMNKNY